jgi:hypothetical protein
LFTTWEPDRDRANTGVSVDAIASTVWERATSEA